MNQVISIPSGLLIGSFEMESIRYDMSELSDVTGAQSGRQFAPPRWMVKMGAMDNMDLMQASEWEGVILDLDGALNVLAVYDPVRIAPRGSMRGTLTLGSGVAIGDTSMTLAGASGTLLKGDWLQIGAGLGTSQLVKVSANASASGGSCVVNFKHPAVRAYSPGVAVAWDKPVVHCRVVGKGSGWKYEAGSLNQSGFMLNLLETFS